MPFLTTLKIDHDPAVEDPHQGTLLAPFIWEHKSFGKIEAPEGFKTDLASVPEKIPFIGWFLRGLLPRGGKAKFGAVIHDYICRHQGLEGRFTRTEARRVFVLINREQEMNIISRAVATTGVAIGDTFTRNKF